MPTISQRGIDMPASPIRKLVPLANRAKAKGTVVYHLNIGQPDLATPEVALRAAHHLDREVLEYSPSEGIQPATRTPDNHQRYRHNARHGAHHHYRRIGSCIFFIYGLSRSGR